MKKLKFITYILALISILFLSMGVVACKENKNDIPPVVFDFELVNSSAKIDIDSTYRIVIKGGLTDGVSYVSENPLIASVNSEGVVVGENVGETKINVTLNNVTKACEIQVVDSGERPHIQLNNVPSNENLKLLKNDEYEIDATLLFKKVEKDTTITFTSSNPSKVLTNGNKIKGVAVGNAEITASATYRGWVAQTTFVVEVVENVQVYIKESQIELSYSDVVGQPTEYSISDFGVIVDEQKLEDPEISWCSTDDKVANVEDGVITAIKEGNVQIKAIYTKDSVEYFAYANVCVVAPYLSAPENVVYDKETTTLSWDEVDYADSYVVSIDGKEISIVDNKCVLGTDGSYFGQYEAKVRAVSNKTEVVDSQNASVDVAVDTIVLDERLKPKDSYIDATIFEEDEYNLISGERIYSVKKGDDDPFYDVEQYGYMFRKLYYTPGADKASSISGWTNSALIGVNEQISKYQKATISFWAYSYDELTLRLLYTDMGKDKSVLGESKVSACTWTKVEFDFSSSKTFKFISFLSSSGDFYFTDMRINLASYVGKDYSNCEFPISGDYNSVNMLINHIKNSIDAENLKPRDYHVIYGAISNYEALSVEDKNKVVDYSYVQQLNEKFLKLYDVEVVYGATEEENGATANSDQKGEAGAEMTYEMNMIYGPAIKITNIGGVQQRINVRINKNVDKKYEGYNLYFNLFSEQTKNITYVNGSIVWTDADGVEGDPVITSGKWTYFDVNSLDLGIYQDNRHVGITKLTANNSFKLSAVFAIKMTTVGQINAKINELCNKQKLVASDYHAIYGIKTTYATLTSSEQEQINYQDLLQIETNFLSKFDVKVVFGATEEENGVNGSTSATYNPTVNYVIDNVYGNVVKLTSQQSTKTYAIISANAYLIYSGYDIYFNVLSEVSSNLVYVNRVCSWATHNTAITAGQWTSYSFNSADLYRTYNGGRHIGIENLTYGKSFSISAVFAIRSLYDGDGQTVFGDTLANKGVTAETSDTWGAVETINMVSSGAVITDIYTYDGTYGDVIKIDLAEGTSNTKTQWAVKLGYQQMLDAINATGAESVTVNIYSTNAITIRLGGFASSSYIHLGEKTGTTSINVGWNTVTITKAQLEGILSYNVSLMYNPNSTYPTTLLVSDFYLNYTK